MPCFIKLSKAYKGTLTSELSKTFDIYINADTIISITLSEISAMPSKHITIVDCVGGQRYSTLEDIEQVLYKCKNIQQG